MITRLRIQGLGSLRSVDVRLGPLTLLLGPNASGKSMFLHALVLLSKVIRSAIRGKEEEIRVAHATLDELVFRHQASQPIAFEVWVNDPEGAPNYVLELGKVEDLWTVTREKASWNTWTYDSAEPLKFATERRGTITWETPGYPPRHATLPYLVYPFRQDHAAASVVQPFLRLQQAIGYAYSFRVNPVALVTPTLPPWIRIDDPHVDTTGLGFPYALQRWHQSIDGGRTFSKETLPALQRLFPHITGVGFRGGPPRLFIEYETKRATKSIPANLESDGVTLALFFLTIPHIINSELPSPSIPLCLCLEEPEAGTHPHLQRDRLDLLRQMAEGRFTGRPSQVVATTHSVDLVRHVEREEALRVLRFVEHVDEERGTAIHQPGAQEDIDRLWELWEGDLGAAWYSGVFGPRQSANQAD